MNFVNSDVPACETDISGHVDINARRVSEKK